MNYLSPTSLKLYLSSKEEFYLKYICRSPRTPQTTPMAVGSAFDAYIKNYLYEKLIGKSDTYQLDNLFESQVEEQNRDRAKKDGKLVFDHYRESGSLADLILELNKRIWEPRFEFEVQGDVEGIPFLGKPDVFFINGEGAHVILDWKVNGFYSKYSISPVKGYIKIRGGRNNWMPHKGCVLEEYKGIKINSAMPLEDCNEDWAIQLAIYAWLLGEEVGSTDLIIGIDQIVGNPHKLRVATHRSRITAGFQHNLISDAKKAWEIINSDHFFRDMELGDSLEKCEVLQHQASMLKTDDPMAKFLRTIE